jgi:hypothetical protein
LDDRCEKAHGDVALAAATGAVIEVTKWLKPLGRLCGGDEGSQEPLPSMICSIEHCDNLDLLDQSIGVADISR